MSGHNLIIIIELFANTFFWWFGIFVLTQNPRDRINQLISALLISFSIFYVSDVLSSTAQTTEEYVFGSKLLSFFIYLPVAILYHLVYVLTKNISPIKKILLILSYIGVIVFTLLDGLTNFIVDYGSIRSHEFFGGWVFSAGPFLYAPLIWAGIVFISIIAQLLLLIKKSPQEKLKYIMPILSVIIFIGAVIIIGIQYYKIIPYFGFIFNGLVGLGVLLLMVSIIFYGFLLNHPLYKDKVFQYSTLAIGIIVVLYSIFIGSTHQVLGRNTIILLLIINPLVITSHYAFDWLNNLTRNIIYNRQIKFSVVSDNEIANAIRFYHRLSRLESSPLLNLKVVERFVKDGKANNQIDALQLVIKDMIEYLKPREQNRRTKQTIKYSILSMLAFDQAEEGQMLWELGFEEYPVRIMSQEGKSRPPKLRVTSPADYTATSRNAFINLKQEAIHDVTSRVSYLEKLARQQ